MAIPRPVLMVILMLALLGAPLAADSQPPGKAARVGVIWATGVFPQFQEAFRSGLQQAGYVEGQNVSIESRSAGGDAERFPELAAELVRLNVEVIVANGLSAARAVRQTSPTIPLVFVAVADPVGSGLVASLARPGGNSTGLAFLTPEANEKRLELLHPRSASSLTLLLLRSTTLPTQSDLRSSNCTAMRIQHSLKK